MCFRLRHVSGLFLVVIAAGALTVHAQERAEKVFEKVPLELRPRLVERLREYVTYEKTRQYERLYELLYERGYQPERADQNPGKEVYAKARQETEGRRGVVQEFTPTSIINVTLNEGDAPTLVLTGRAKVLLKARTVKGEMSIHARFQDGEWYFSELLESYLHID